MLLRLNECTIHPKLSLPNLHLNLRAYKRFTMIADAPPPPLHTAAHPYSPGCSKCTSVTIMREPDDPSACPSATAPPRTLVFWASRPRILALARATAEKASLTSHLAMSAIARPAFLSAIGIAAEGAVPNSAGAQAASAKAGRKEARHLVSLSAGGRENSRAEGGAYK